MRGLRIDPGLKCFEETSALDIRRFVGREQPPLHLRRCHEDDTLKSLDVGIKAKGMVATLAGYLAQERETEEDKRGHDGKKKDLELSRPNPEVDFRAEKSVFMSRSSLQRQKQNTTKQGKKLFPEGSHVISRCVGGKRKPDL